MWVTVSLYNCMPMNYITEQQTILFYVFYRRKYRLALSFISLLQLEQGFVSSLLVKYNIRSLSLPIHVTFDCFRGKTTVVIDTER